MNLLTEEEKTEIENEAMHYPDKKAVCIEALKIVQKHRGWISNKLLEDVAVLLKMTPDELDNVATFYNLLFRKPVGRHVILVCDSVSCWITGYEQLRKRLQSKLGIGIGGTTADQRFTLLPIVCLGACGGAPAMMIDGDLHENLDPAKIDTILESYT
jgi:NADH-quinone oxidoreductase subunit E